MGDEKHISPPKEISILGDDDVALLYEDGRFSFCYSGDSFLSKKKIDFFKVYANDIIYVCDGKLYVLLPFMRGLYEIGDVDFKVTNIIVPDDMMIYLISDTSQVYAIGMVSVWDFLMYENNNFCADKPSYRIYPNKVELIKINAFEGLQQILKMPENLDENASIGLYLYADNKRANIGLDIHGNMYKLFDKTKYIKDWYMEKIDVPIPISNISVSENCLYLLSK